jgi:uncharacterized protein YciW
VTYRKTVPAVLEPGQASTDILGLARALALALALALVMVMARSNRHHRQNLNSANCGSSAIGGSSESDAQQTGCRPQRSRA